MKKLRISYSTWRMVFAMTSSFMIMSVLFSQAVSAQDYAENIRINQEGYYPDAPKIAVVADSIDSKFLIVNANTGKEVFSSDLSGPQKSSYSPHITRIADFSVLNIPGEYRLVIPGKGISYIFKIERGVLCGLTKGLIKGFYYQRMSIPLLPAYAGKWTREEGHPDDHVIIHPAAAGPGRPAGTVISCPRGWYDAGDYNKYIVNSGITMGTLLSLYEDFPAYFDNLNLNIPESSDNSPDILNEILWNLRWMFTMQDPSDGGVYNKVTNADFEGFVMPSKAVAPRYIIPKGTAATLDFAAVMAQASRVFGKFKIEFPGLSDSCKQAAEKAWKWAQSNPDVLYDQNRMNKEYEPAISTGGYGDSDFRDEFIWAATELYITTKKSYYYDAVNIIPDSKMPLPTWNNVRLLGYYTLARFHNDLTGNALKEFPKMKTGLLREADRMINDVSETAYHCVMGESVRDFVWGSNSVATNEGILLINAYKLTGEKKYLDQALGNIDYIMGRNATGFSYVTGFGDRTPMHPHHRPSEADGIAEPVPGLIVGGPNPGQQDGCDTYTSRISDESYTDTVCSYASNEIAINWNAPAAYLAGAIDAIYSMKMK